MKKVISLCDRYSLLPSGGLVLAAVSGGKDSMCLLDILYKLKDRYGYELCAIHFNHMIRGKSADRDENFVMETCRNRKIKFIAGRGDTLKSIKSGLKRRAGYSGTDFLRRLPVKRELFVWLRPITPMTTQRLYL